MCYFLFVSLAGDIAGGSYRWYGFLDIFYNFYPIFRPSITCYVYTNGHML